MSDEQISTVEQNTGQGIEQNTVQSMEQNSVQSNVQNTVQNTEQNIGKVGRNVLAEKFSDNQTPTGSDFSELIHSGINQLDDGIIVEENSIDITKKVQLIDPDSLSVTSFISHNEINIADKVKLSSGEVESFEVYDGFVVNKNDEFTGKVEVAKTDVSGNTYALDVMGNSKLQGKLELDGMFTATSEVTFQDGLDVVGEAHLNSTLAVDGVSTLSQVKIGAGEGTSDALLNISNKTGEVKDLLRLEDTTEDPSPFVVKGNGRVGISTADPQNLLDVNGNVRIGSSALMEGLDNSLSVEKRLGIGTAHPSAMLDVHSIGEQDLVNITKNGETLVKIKATDVLDTPNILLNSRTQVADDLEVTGSLTTGPTEVKGELIAGSSIISGVSQSAILVVGPETTTEDGPVNLAPATFNLDVNAKGLTSLQTTNVYGKLNATKQLSAQYANVRDKLSVGLPDDAIADAVLQVKSTGADSSAFLVNDHENKDLVRVKTGKVDLGSDNNSVNLKIHGDTVSQSLTVSGLSNLVDANVADHLLVGDLISENNPNVRFSVTSDISVPEAISIRYKDGTVVTDLLHSKTDKLGVHINDPQVAFHVGAESQFDEAVNFANGISVFEGFNVFGSDAEVNTFSVTNTQVTSGAALAPLPFDIFGDTRITGSFSVNSVLSANEKSLTLNQQASDTPFKIEQTDSIKYIHATAGTLAINTPLSDYNFGLLGDAKIAGRLVIEHNGKQSAEQNGPESDGTKINALDVTGCVEISDQLTIRGETTLNDAVTVSGPLTVNYSGAGENDVSALNIQGHGVISESLTVSDTLTVANGATVTGMGTFNNNLFVLGATDLDQTLDVTGKITAKDELHIQGNELSKVSMTVDKRADFRDNLAISGDIGFSTVTPDARLHIHQTDFSKAAFKIDVSGEENSGLIFTQGKLGIGIDKPDEALEVAGTAKITKDLHVKRQTYLDNCLYVDQLATFSSNIKVHGMSELNGQTVIGDLNFPDNDAARTAQLCLFQNNYASAFKIMFEQAKPVVFSRGKLGIGTDNPQAELDVVGKVDIDGPLFVKDKVEIRGKVTQLQGADVWGDVVLHSDLTVGDNTILQDTLDVMGKTTLNNTLEVTRGSSFLSTLDVAEQVTFGANLDVSNNTNLKGDLTVSSANATVTFSPATTLENTLTVNRSSLLRGKVQIDDALAIGLDKQQTQARLHIVGEADKPAFIVDLTPVESTPAHLTKLATTDATSENGHSVVGENQRALTLSADGKLGLNCNTPMATLDVKGNASIEQELMAQKVIVDTVVVDKVIVNNAISFQDSDEITGFSNDVTLGGNLCSDSILPTQSAVKAYIDETAWSFGGGGKTFIINNQSDFDAVFNTGDNVKILDNTTILLFPFVSHSSICRKYILKNPVHLGSGVTITGFNEKTTCIVKETAACRFIIKGDNSSAVVETIKLSGFTFDGGNYIYPASGGAFELKYARNCQINCHIVNHKSADNGGAIYGAMEHGNHTVTNIEALHIRYCSAENNAGGGAYGLAQSQIRANYCAAKYGGAVACCDESKVEATDNSATVYGGGAYFCNNLLCDGFWKNNHAPIGKNIYANNCHSETETNLHDEKYYWHALYLDTPIVDNNDFWRTDNL